MTVTTVNNDNNITVSLDGWLDTVSSPELGAEIEKIKEAKTITLDFDKVEYISSAGLRQIVSCLKKAKCINADFSIINVNNEVMSIFTLTCFDKKMNIKPKE